MTRLIALASIVAALATISAAWQWHEEAMWARVAVESQR